MIFNVFFSICSFVFKRWTKTEWPWWFPVRVSVRGFSRLSNAMLQFWLEQANCEYLHVSNNQMWVDFGRKHLRWIVRQEHFPSCCSRGIMSVLPPSSPSVVSSTWRPKAAELPETDCVQQALVNNTTIYIACCPNMHPGRRVHLSSKHAQHMTWNRCYDWEPAGIREAVSTLATTSQCQPGNISSTQLSRSRPNYSNSREALGWDEWEVKTDIVSRSNNRGEFVHLCIFCPQPEIVVSRFVCIVLLWGCWM